MIKTITKTSTGKLRKKLIRTLVDNLITCDVMLTVQATGSMTWQRKLFVKTASGVLEVHSVRIDDDDNGNESKDKLLYSTDIAMGNNGCGNLRIDVRDNWTKYIILQINDYLYRNIVG